MCVDYNCLPMSLNIILNMISNYLIVFHHLAEHNIDVFKQCPDDHQHLVCWIDMFSRNLEWYSGSRRRDEIRL